MTQTVSEIISSSSWFRAPLSRSAAYLVEQGKIKQGQASLVKPSWYHYLGKKSRGQAIGAAVGIGFLGWFLGDLVKKWGDGGFWRRFGLLLGSAFGWTIASFAKPVQDLFVVDLFTSAILKIKDKVTEFIKPHKTQDQVQQAFFTELETLKDELEDAPNGDIIPIKNSKKLLAVINNFLEKFGLKIEVEENKDKNSSRFFISTKDSFSASKQNQDATYHPFVAIEIPVKSIQNLINEFAIKMEDAKLRISDPNKLNEYANQLLNQMFLGVAPTMPTIGYFETRGGVQSEYMVNKRPEFILQCSHILRKVVEKWKNPLSTNVVKVSEKPVASAT